jgi:hypothetical protein
MAILRVDPQLLMARLLPGAQGAVLTDIRLDENSQLFLTIEGPGVPDCKEVIAIITARQEAVEFKPYGGKS